ncbi:hypothetical protein [Methanococcoides sp. FTZ1]
MASASGSKDSENRTEYEKPDYLEDKKNKKKSPIKRELSTCKDSQSDLM